MKMEVIGVSENKDQNEKPKKKSRLFRDPYAKVE